MRFLDIFRGGEDLSGEVVLLLIPASDSEIYLWDGRKVKPLGGSGFGHSLCVHENNLMEGTYNFIWNFNKRESFDTKGYVSAVCSHKGVLHHATYPFPFSEGEKSYIYETIGGKKVAERETHVTSLCSNEGRLYDGNFEKGVFETALNKQISSDRNVNALGSHLGKLYDGTLEGEIYDTFASRKIAQRDEGIWAFCSVNDILYDSVRGGRIYETFTGRLALDFRGIEHLLGGRDLTAAAMVPVPRALALEFEKVLKTYRRCP